MMYGHVRKVGKLSIPSTSQRQVRMESSLVLDRLRINIRFSDVGSGVVLKGN